MKIIKLTHSKKAIVDDEDFEYLNKWKWHFDGHYARRRDYKPNKLIRMHTQIIKIPLGKETDHKNGNKLDNRKENLRIASRSENLMNKSMQKNNTSGFRGVYWSKIVSKWMAYIKKNGKRYHLGYYINIYDAAKAYNLAADKMFGEFARFNKI